MSKVIVDHEKYGKVLFNTETQEYNYITANKYKIFKYNNKFAVFFDNYTDFINSDINIAVVPAICFEAKQHKRRTYVELVDSNNYSLKFFNVEMINSRWKKNIIKNIYKSNCYFLLLSRNNQAVNDCLLLSSLQIKKGMHKALP